MKNWFNYLLDFKHDVTVLVEKIGGGSFSVSPKVLFKDFFLPLEVEVIFEYNNFLDSGVEFDERCGICLFEYRESDYILFAEGDEFNTGSYRMFRVNDTGVVRLWHLLSFITSNYRLPVFQAVISDMLLADKIFKEKKCLANVIPESVNELVGVVKV